MDLQFLKNYFAQDYKGIRSIIQEVFIPIFGAENFEDGLDVLTRGETAFARKAREHKITSITYYGKFYTEDLESIKAEAERTGLRYVRHLAKNNWVAAEFEK